MSLPGAARALGLGEIRIDSALNEPLSAQIDILGATRDELMALTAKVANREIFQRYNADRPAFLSSATFKVGVDAEGRPVLNIRSGEAFTDPVVSFVVDLRWGRNEIVREYSLLLDPAGFNSSRPATEVALASAARAPATATTNAAALPTSTTLATAATNAVAAGGSAARGEPLPRRTQSTRSRPARAPAAAATIDPQAAAVGDSAGHAHHRIAAGDTLRGIARRAGARSESQVQRMMIAIFRANPAAFEDNINRLRRGAVLGIPTAAELAAISAADAKREVRAQMTAWRLDGRPGASHQAATQSTVATDATGTARTATSAATTATPAATATTAATSTASATAGAGTAEPAPTAKDEGKSPSEALQSRVQSLEQALDDMHKQLVLQNAKLQDLKVSTATQAAATAQPSTAAADDSTADPAANSFLAAVASPRSMRSAWGLGSVAVVLSLLLAGFAYMRRRLMRGAPQPAVMAEAESHEETVPNLAFPGLSSTYVDTTSQTFDGSATPTAAVPPPAAPAILDAEPVPPRGLASQTTVSLEIDTEALERSYIDALGIDAAELEAAYGEPPAATTAAPDMEPVDTADVDTAVLSELNTLVLDLNTLEAATVAAMPATPAAATPAAATAATAAPRAGNLPSPMAFPTSLDYNLTNLDATAEHVQMPSGLNDRAVVSEGRMNIVDALKSAIDRDPYRRDLRMKLLETYYSAASTNQHAFMDIVKTLAGEREQLSPEEWSRVLAMGREIAPDDALFTGRPADDSKDDELANCA